MHRFFLPSEQCQSPSPVLEGREAHHALHVLRLKPGESIEILDGQGGLFTSLITQCDRRTLTINVTGRHVTPRPETGCVLYQGLLKPKAMEWILQKATELGVSRIVPLQTRHSVARMEPGSPKLEKWSWITIDALKQCGGLWLPDLENPMTVFDGLLSPNQPELSLAASLQSRCHPRKHFQNFQAAHQRPPRSVGIWIGPEGDFTEEELNRMLAAGVLDMSLGSRTLRSETAALYSLSLARYELED